MPAYLMADDDLATVCAAMQAAARVSTPAAAR
jgi:hypothetical protein